MNTMTASFLSVLLIAGLFPKSIVAAEHAEASYYANAYAKHYHVPPELVNAIIQQESGWRERAVSRKGACGLMQLMPSTATRFRVRDSFSIQDNISGGVRYLSQLLTQYHGDIRLAVAAYYAGEGRIHGLHYSNQQVIFYVTQVRRRYLNELSRTTQLGEVQR